MKGAFPLFRLAGIQVYLHFTWFIIAALEIGRFAQRYHNPLWGAAEYLSLFLIVLVHEFGHAFACRQTGGQANHIVLWPLGGVAFVKPPPRATAYLWSIAAGPLVNAVLFPFLMVLVIAAAKLNLRFAEPDFYKFISALFFMNAGLLFFNLLPVYPLDGGQIVRGLLWLKLGPIRSLKVASVIGSAAPSCLLSGLIWPVPFGLEFSPFSSLDRPRSDGAAPRPLRSNRRSKPDAMPRSRPRR